MKEVKVTMVFHIDETTEHGKEVIKEMEETTVDEFNDEDEVGCTTVEYHCEMKDI